MPNKKPNETTSLLLHEAPLLDQSSTDRDTTVVDITNENPVPFVPLLHVMRFLFPRFLTTDEFDAQQSNQHAQASATSANFSAFIKSLLLLRGVSKHWKGVIDSYEILSPIVLIQYAHRLHKSGKSDDADLLSKLPLTLPVYVIDTFRELDPTERGERNLSIPFLRKLVEALKSKNGVNLQSLANSLLSLPIQTTENTSPLFNPTLYRELHALINQGDLVSTEATTEHVLDNELKKARAIMLKGYAFHLIYSIALVATNIPPLCEILSRNQVNQIMGIVYLIFVSWPIAGILFYFWQPCENCFGIEKWREERNNFYFLHAFKDETLTKQPRVTLFNADCSHNGGGAATTPNENDDRQQNGV